MTKILQSVCLAAYRIVAATGFFDTRFGEKLFFAAYEAYKESIEARTADTLAQWVPAGTVVIDVGANIGFFTVRFARWVGQSGRVIAIEPEARNIRQLRRRIENDKIGAHVEVVEGVAAESSGTLHLVLNPHHPADHKIGASGMTVRSWTIDELWRDRQRPNVSLIKIDVQGAEIRVLRGARETILQCHPAIFVEVDDAALRAAGYSADQLFDEIESLGYSIYNTSGESAPIIRAEAATHRRTLGYADYLCRR